MKSAGQPLQNGVTKSGPNSQNEVAPGFLIVQSDGKPASTEAASGGELPDKVLTVVGRYLEIGRLVGGIFAESVIGVNGTTTTDSVTLIELDLLKPCKLENSDPFTAPEGAEDGKTKDAMTGTMAFAVLLGLAKLGLVPLRVVVALAAVVWHIGRQDWQVASLRCERLL